MEISRKKPKFLLKEMMKHGEDILWPGARIYEEESTTFFKIEVSTDNFKKIDKYYIPEKSLYNYKDFSNNDLKIYKDFRIMFNNFEKTFIKNNVFLNYILPIYKKSDILFSQLGTDFLFMVDINSPKELIKILKNVKPILSDEEIKYGDKVINVKDLHLYTKSNIEDLNLNYKTIYNNTEIKIRININYKLNNELKIGNKIKTYLTNCNHKMDVNNMFYEDANKLTYGGIEGKLYFKYIITNQDDIDFLKLILNIGDYDNLIKLKDNQNG